MIMMSQQHNHNQQPSPPPPPPPPVPAGGVSPASQTRGDKTATTTAATANNNCTDAERGWTFHRNREQPTPDPNEPAINQIKFYLDRYRIKEALQIFFDESTLKLLRVESDFMWDIIPLICKRLRGLCQYRFRVFEGCERMLCRIAIDESCNPKEVLISLLAEIGHQDDHCDDDNVFRAMIRPLEGTLLRMNHPSPRDENLRWVLNVLIRHINDIELPQEYNLEGKKRLALPNDPSVRRFTEVLPLMLSFIEEFKEGTIDCTKSTMPVLTESQIDEVFNGELVDDDLMTEHSPSRGGLDASVTALQSLMYKPLAFLDLTTHCPDLRLFANKCLSILLRLQPDRFSPIYKRLCESTNTTEFEYCFNNNGGGIGSASNESTISLATCSYVYRCERAVSFESVQYFPQVITHEYMLLCHIPYIVALLERSEILVHEKGLLLLANLLKQLNHDSLDQKFLDLFEASMLHKQLFRIMVFSPLCTNRRKAYDMFTCICDLLTHDCKLKIFKYVLTQSDLRPCVRAACIDQYRKHLTNAYRELMNLQHCQLPIQSLSDSDRISSTGLPSEEYDQISSSSGGGSIQKLVTTATVSTDIDNIDLVNHKSDAISGSRPSTADCAIQTNKIIQPRHIVQHLRARYRALGGSVLVEFLDLCVKACLPDSQHTDIIENYELLLATLTMFRFLKLRKIIFKDEVEENYLSGKRLKKTFFDPIRSAIALIMNELKLHHKDTVDGHKSKNVKITPGSILSITQSTNEFDTMNRVLGPLMNELDNPEVPFNLQDEADCLNWALCRLELVESVLVRTCDLYNC